MWAFQQDTEIMPQLPDGQLIHAVLQGDEHAFEALIWRYAPGLFRYITARLGDYDFACDVLQQVWVQLYLSLPSLHQQHSLRPWLVQVTRHKIADEVRRKRWVPFSELDQTDETQLLRIPSPSTLLPEEHVASQELRNQLNHAIATLPTRYRQVVTLRYLAQLPFAEISRLIGIPPATVKTQCQRAKLLLQAALRAEESVEELPEAATGDLSLRCFEWGESTPTAI